MTLLANGLMLCAVFILSETGVLASTSSSSSSRNRRMLINDHGTLITIIKRNNPGDLCLLMTCSKPKGSWCQVFTGKDGTQKPRCVCPKTCPSEPHPVCSNYGRQYDNECLLHKEACRKHRQITVSYHGECLAKQAPCSKEDFAEFPFRLLNWFLHLREIDEFGVVNDTTTQALMTKKQRKELAKWQFEVLDINKDGTLSQRDLMEFRYRLMPLEHCAGEFFRSCDANGKQNVRLEEWIYCLVKRSEKWYEEFMARKMGPKEIWLKPKLKV